MRKSARVVRTQRAACSIESNGWRATNEELFQLTLSFIAGTNGQPSHVPGSGCDLAGHLSMREYSSTGSSRP